TPIVGMEPSCISVFRDELPDLLPRDERAKKLSTQVYTVAEFLSQREYTPPHLDKKALYFGHCHHRSVLGTDRDVSLLQRIGIDVEALEATTCCGLAGSFGFEAGRRYEVSMQVGEQGVLPIVRGADPETIIVADGFSCRTQIEQGTGRG